MFYFRSYDSGPSLWKLERPEKLLYVTGGSPDIEADAYDAPSPYYLLRPYEYDE